MTVEELHELERLAGRVQDHGIVVETGSLYGRSSFALAGSVKPGVQVYCIDPFERAEWIIDLEGKNNWPVFGFDAFRGYVQDCDNIIPIVGHSPDVVADWWRPVDLFFDDSVHENPWFRNNLRFWLRQMRPGGVMSGHDYCDQWPHVVQEVDRLAAELGVAVEVAGWVWSLRVPPDHAPSLPLRTRMRRTAEAVSRALGRRPSPRTRGV